jgi:hypothetical protein
MLGISLFTTTVSWTTHPVKQVLVVMIPDGEADNFPSSGASPACSKYSCVGG